MEIRDDCKSGGYNEPGSNDCSCKSRIHLDETEVVDGLQCLQEDAREEVGLPDERKAS